MLKRFYPDNISDSVSDIEYEQLYKRGYRGILFDIDNTLVKHGAGANKDIIQLFQHLKALGFQTCLISNNKKERVERFNKRIQTNYIYNAHKPAKKNYYKAMELMNTKLNNTIFVGDQLFTDVYGAKRIGMKNYLVKPIDPKEEIQIVIKRRLERIVLYFYRKSKKREKNKV